MLPLAPSSLAAAVGGREPPLLPVVRAARPEGPQRLPHLRPAHGPARPPTSRALTAPFDAALAAERRHCSSPLAASSACGGSSVSDAAAHARALTLALGAAAAARLGRVPKSTPEHHAATDTSAETARVKTTSTATTRRRQRARLAKAPRAESEGEAPASRNRRSGELRAAPRPANRKKRPKTIGGALPRRQRRNRRLGSPTGGASAPSRAAPAAWPLAGDAYGVEISVAL